MNYYYVHRVYIYTFSSEFRGGSVSIVHVCM